MFVIEERNARKIQAFVEQRKSAQKPCDEASISSFRDTLGIVKYGPLSSSFTADDREHMSYDIDSADESWGAYAVLQDCEAQDSEIPAQPLALGRTMFVVTPSLLFCFFITDALMSIGSFTTRYRWVFAVMLSFAAGIEIFARFYERHMATHRSSDISRLQATAAADQGQQPQRTKSRATEHSIEMLSRASEFVQSNAKENESDGQQSTQNPIISHQGNV